MKSETVRYVCFVLIIGFAVFFLLRINDNKVGQYQIASTNQAFVIIDTRSGEIVQNVGLASQTNMPTESNDQNQMMRFIDYVKNDVYVRNTIDVQISGALDVWLYDF